MLRRELDRAEELLDAMLAPDTPIEALGHVLLTCARVELALARGEPNRALELIGRATGGGERPFPRIEALHAEALIALGRRDEAEELLVRLLCVVEQRQLRPLQWRAHASMGDLHWISGRHGDAEMEYQQARAIVGSLAATLNDEQPAQAFLVNASTVIGQTPGRGRPERDQHAFGGLTQREREVAALIGQGLSNAEIAAALFVGKRTVETHISSIYRKLNYTSRTQIALWAVELGLAERARGEVPGMRSVQ